MGDHAGYKKGQKDQPANNKSNKQSHGDFRKEPREAVAGPSGGRHLRIDSIRSHIILHINWYLDIHLIHNIQYLQRFL